MQNVLQSTVPKPWYKSINHTNVWFKLIVPTSAAPTHQDAMSAWLNLSHFVINIYKKDTHYRSYLK